MRDVESKWLVKTCTARKWTCQGARRISALSRFECFCRWR